MLAKSGVLEEKGDSFVVAIGPEDPLPEEMPGDLEEFATRMTGLYPHGLTEIGCFGALAMLWLRCFAVARIR